MSRSCRRTARSAASRIASSCLLGAAIVGGSAMGAAAPAFASCTSDHSWVQGKDQNNSTAYGNKGYIYVNTSSIINNLQDAIARSFFVIMPSGYNVEVGWAANENGYKGPIVYAEWAIDGSTQAPVYDPNSNGRGLATDSNYRFRVDNAGNVGIWRFIFDGDSSPFTYSPTMPSNYGAPYVQSEHFNSCDSLYTHQYDLSYSEPSYWVSGYDNLVCTLNDSPDWYFHKNSNSDWDSSQTSSTC